MHWGRTQKLFLFVLHGSHACACILKIVPRFLRSAHRYNTWRQEMKKLLTTVALATFAASPAFAASYKHAAQTAATPLSSYSAYAPTRTSGYGTYASVLDRDTVAAGDEIVGRDPDAGIRLQLRRDPEPSQY
jgi:hypothetical protein